MKDTQWNMTPNKAKAVMLAKRQLAELVCDAVNLEGIHFTLPEIQTLLDGVTVGKYEDQQKINFQGRGVCIFCHIKNGRCGFRKQFQ